MNGKRFLLQTTLLLSSLVVMIALNRVTISEHTDYRSSYILPSDTTKISVCGAVQSLVVKDAHGLFIDLEDFTSFANVYCDQPLRYEQVQQIDTTGDGATETVTTSVAFTEQGCLVKNSITKAGETLWEDELLIDDVQGARLFGGTENYQQLYPLSAFFLGMVNASFLDELKPGSKDFDYRKKFMLNKLAGTEDIGQLKAAHQSKLADYMDNYKGKYLFRLNMSARDIYIWDSLKKAFVPIYLS